MPYVDVKGLAKKFGRVLAVDDVSFRAEDGKLMTLLGPSGCGKSTTLRCIAGLERPDAGEICIGQRMVVSVEKQVFVLPHHRELAMVFQSYAVWPHMDVFGNVAYGLKYGKKLAKDNIKEKVRETLQLIGLEGLEKRYPSQLSGGQQQRVALARSLVLEPEVLLLDEPLSNLDAKLRERMRFELKELQGKLGITFIYVTHDQGEAMAISDSIAVINKGRLIQVGSPREIYNKPNCKWIADFIGSANFLAGKVLEKQRESPLGIVESEEGIIIQCYLYRGLNEGDKVILSIRPEDLKMDRSRPDQDYNVWMGEIKKVTYLGDHTDYRVLIGDKEFRINSNKTFEQREKAYVSVSPENAIAIQEV